MSQSNENIFPVGIFVKPPHENAPDFVKGKISIKTAEAIGWLQQQGEWVNLDMKVSQEGKLYLAVDTWQPNSGGGQQSAPPPAASAASEFDDDVPF